MHKRLQAPVSVVALLALGAPAFAIIINDVDQIVENHRNRQQELLAAQSTILATVDEEKRELSTEEGKELDELQAEFTRLGNEIDRRERVMAQAALMNSPRGRQSDPEDPADPENAARRPSNLTPDRPVATTPATPRATPGGTGGFRNFGDFAIAVRNGSAKGAELDKRLRPAAAGTPASESVGGDGGFLVPPDFRADIMAKVFSEQTLIGQTDILRSGSNQITIPVDMTTPWQETGGIQAYWTGEASAITQSRPVFEEVTVKAHKLAVLVPVTEELAEDSSALDGYLRRKVPEKMDFKISNAIVRGDGVGKPLGFLNGPALATVTAEGGQSADTLVAANIAKMFAAMPASSRQSAVWLIHPDAEHQLMLMTLGNQPIYMPAGGLSARPYGTLLGRPVIPHQVCETLGDLGDILFIDPKQYLALLKTGGGRDAGGMKTDVSMHLWFDQDLLAYKTTVRLGGQPWWSTATASRDGSFTQSPFVALAAR